MEILGRLIEVDCRPADYLLALVLLCHLEIRPNQLWLIVWHSHF